MFIFIKLITVDILPFKLGGSINIGISIFVKSLIFLAVCNFFFTYTWMMNESIICILECGFNFYEFKLLSLDLPLLFYYHTKLF